MQPGESFPSDVVFQHIPWAPESQEVTSCGIPIAYNASKEWANKKVVLFSVPGAFTPTCSVEHLPGYLKRLSEVKGKGVDVVAVVASNDPFVMSAWGKANGVKEDMVFIITTPRKYTESIDTGINEQLFLSDPDARFAQQLGWANNGRTGRWAMVIDHGKVVYADIEKEKGVKVSGVDAVLAHL